MSERPNLYIWPWKEPNPLTISEWPSPYIWTWKEPNPLTMLEWPSPYIWPWKEPHPLPCQNGPALTSDLLVRMVQPLHLTYSSEWPITHIRSCENTSDSNIRMALSPRLIFPGNWPGTSILLENGINLYIWSSRNQSSITLEWICPHIRSCKTTSYSCIRKARSPRPSILDNWPGTSIPRMATALISNHVGTNPTVISE